MYKINDVVIHKSCGACIIHDIVTQNFGNGDVQYYYMKPVYSSNINDSLEIYLPVAKESDFLRKPLSEEGVLNLIRSFKDMEIIWAKDAKSRKALFEEIYHSGDANELCKLVKLLYLDPESLGKPITSTDRIFLNKIKNNLYDEFAVALNIKPNEVEPFIKNNINA